MAWAAAWFSQTFPIFMFKAALKESLSSASTEKYKQSLCWMLKEWSICYL